MDASIDRSVSLCVYYVFQSWLHICEYSIFRTGLGNVIKRKGVCFFRLRGGNGGRLWGVMFTFWEKQVLCSYKNGEEISGLVLIFKDLCCQKEEKMGKAVSAF
jgi:hypothetical protein